MGEQPMMITPTTSEKRLVNDALRQPGTAIVFDGRESIVDELSVSLDDIMGSEIWLDFSNVDIVNSLDLSALIRFRLRMLRHGKSLRVCNVGLILSEIFAITRFPPKESL